MALPSFNLFQWVDTYMTLMYAKIQTLWLSVSLGQHLHDLDVHKITNSNFEFQQYYKLQLWVPTILSKENTKLSVRDSTVCFGLVTTVSFFSLLHHAFSLRSSEVSWSEVAQEANADVLPNRLQRGRVEVRVVRHCNRGQSCTLLQQRSELYVTAKEVRVVHHCNRGQSCTASLQQRSELYIVTATEVRVVSHCSKKKGEMWVCYRCANSLPVANLIISVQLLVYKPSTCCWLTGWGRGGGGELTPAKGVCWEYK